MSRNWTRTIPALALSLAAACGTASIEGADDLDSDADALSDGTPSMEMIRSGARAAAGVTPPLALRVRGKVRPFDNDGVERGYRIVKPGSFLYTGNQLDQFLKLTDPGVHHEDKDNATWSRQPGDLFADDGVLTWQNVQQGHLGDCYFAAGLAAVLFADKSGSWARNVIVPRKIDGKVVSWYVYFYQASGRRVRIEVDPDLLHRTANGKVLYMRSTDTKPGYEEWAASLIEKAYAVWHGSYEAIGNGGYAADAIWALRGKRTTYFASTDSRLPAWIEWAARYNRVQTACTYGDDEGVDYEGTGVYGDHCYALRGIRKDAAGKVFVLLRNPWGPTTSQPSEPPTDGVNDGTFELDLATFKKLYRSADVVTY